MASAFQSHSRSSRTITRVTMTDDESDTGEQWFISMGTGVKGRVLVVVYNHRGRMIRIISARLAEARERSQYEESR